MFTFRLEPVLNHREAIEDSLKKEVAMCKTLLDQEKKKFRSYTKTKHRMLGDLRRKQKGHMSISEMLLYVSFIEQLTRDLELQKQKVVEAEKKLDLKRERLVAAMKGKKSLEKLKEKGWKVHQKNELKEEQNFLNEMGIYRFNAR